MIRPLGDRILVKKVESDKKTSGGIYIPDTVETTSMEGVVVAVGPGSYDKNGKRKEMHVSEGQRVVFGKWSGEELVVDGEEHLMLVEEDIIGVLKERS